MTGPRAWAGAEIVVKVEPANGFGIILDKTEEIVNDILFVHSHIDQRLLIEKANNKNKKINFFQ